MVFSRSRGTRWAEVASGIANRRAVPFARGSAAANPAILAVRLATPHTRGLAAHAALEHVDGFRWGAAAAVRGRIPAASLAEIRGCAALGWISVEHERWVTQSVFDVLGPDGAEYFRWLVTRHLVHAPILRPMVERTTRLFGIDPGTFLRVAPMAWDVMFRDFCTTRLASRGVQHAVFELVDCAPEVFEYPRYVDSWCGVVASTFDLSHVQGRVDCERDPEARAVRFELRW